MLLAMWTGVQYTVPPFAQAADLATIQRRGYLIVAVKDNLPPLGFQDASGTLQGLEIDLARRLAEELLGQPTAVELRPVANQDRLAALLADEVDIVIARMTISASRARLVDFSETYYLDGTALITRDRTLQRASQLRQRAIAVLNRSSTIAVVRSRLPQAELVGVDSYQDALALLEAGRVAAFAADASVLTGWVQDNPTYQLLPERLSGEALAIAMPRGNQYQSLRQRINQTLVRWKETGWLGDRIRFWGL
ncbi:MAG: transporter substrate-binding domain-containing protein [Cyanobacteria bacterium J069]|nr:MAG: ABC transporter substrate-binding protein [Cyanobacteria bacterium J069]